MVKTGKKNWVIPDGYLPPKSSNDMESHESVCILNLNKDAANIVLKFFFENRPPMGGFQVKCQGLRTNHIRIDKLKNHNEEEVPKGTPYALKIESDKPVFVQLSRLDSTQKELALMTTMAWPSN